MSKNSKNQKYPKPLIKEVVFTLQAQNKEPFSEQWKEY